MPTYHTGNRKELENKRMLAQKLTNAVNRSIAFWDDPHLVKESTSAVAQAQTFVGHARTPNSVLSLLFSPVRRRSMPRKGWQSLDAVWLGASSEETTPSVSEMATSAGRTSCSPEVVAAGAIAVVKRLENAIQVLGETNPHAQPLVEALRVTRVKTLSRTCQATSCSSRKCHARAIEQKENLHQGGLRRQEPPLDVDVRRIFSPCARLSFARRTRVAADRRVEKGTRFVESRTNTDSQRASRDVVRGWSAICEGDPTHANRPPRLARLDHRTQLRILRTHWSSPTMPQLRRWCLSTVRAQHSSLGSRDVVMDGSTKSALPWTSLFRVSSTRGAYTCVRALPSPNTKRSYVCHKCVHRVPNGAYLCSLRSHVF